ncbi:hypothetical protein ALC62_04217 [Cyphomyrmex costatus]|uniref:Uncharacterized protein n=1 Tax=Cyphomyrmex costatus TaxID=456900 RepID=A0A195CVX3_9HYME|nr:hypothetical protein ALC62_04217 [Cyphomyrmex costatus]
MNHSIRVSLDAWLPTEIHDEQLIRLTAARKFAGKIRYVPCNAYTMSAEWQIDRNIVVKKTQKYFVRSFLGGRKILNARRYMVVYIYERLHLARLFEKFNCEKSIK